MEGEAVKNKEHPLAGVVLCFTSILPEQRSKLAEIASQMGATHKYDLTSDVTHLLVGDTNTEKYKFVARERSDVLVLMPEWIEAVRQSWMEGGDTDLKALEKQYKFPTFHGLSICVTGFDDPSYRTYLQETAIANGADFRKDLTKNVTHLVAHQPSGQKYKFATQWQIKVVSAKWFSDSLERGMVLDEARYDILLPPKEQGVGAWNRTHAQVPVKRNRSADSSNTRSRKLRRAASSKLGDQNETIWNDIMGGGSNSFDKGGTVSTSTSTGPQARETPTQVLNFFETEPSADSPNKTALEEDVSSESKGFLQGCYFYMNGFSSKQIPRHEVPSTEDKGFSCELVTDMWLERCLDAKTLVSPEAHVTSTPFPRLPLNGAKYEEYFTPNVSVLICNDPKSVNPEKLRHALQWGVPVVSADWLWISVQSSQKKAFEPYIVHKPALQKKDTLAHEDSTKVQVATDIGEKSSSANSGRDAKSQSRQTSLPAIEPNKSTPSDAHGSTGRQSNDAADASLPSHSRQPTQGSDDKIALKAIESKTEDNRTSIATSRNSFSSLESAMDGFLEKARALTRARNVMGGESGTRRRRPNLGRTNSLSSARNDSKRPESRASSIDTLNEDGYGSAVSVDTDGNKSLTGRLSRTFTGQSLQSLLNGSKYTRYIDAPIPENDELLDDENGTPAMTQLNYDDPDAMAVREEIMRLARRGNADEAYVSEKLKQKEPIHPQVVVDESPQVVDKLGGRATTRRTRRSAGKQQKEDDFF
ncbi:hypothetical protein UA08_06598 [Talaromyces atroroseus]|uniref:BRCT domain-containing protein n=1 Tax=Talaromyces atroroseus TaxID=1441469 RepID=A0A225AAP8_TALAT|nr:hypothetical protein UA08_06598 [Talaromyces atroroseus]OKL58061.1 hypothetical protein UA08_06598 [Talaromyces atroroseus]